MLLCKRMLALWPAPEVLLSLIMMLQKSVSALCCDHAALAARCDDVGRGERRVNPEDLLQNNECALNCWRATAGLPVAANFAFPFQSDPVAGSFMISSMSSGAHARLAGTN